LSARALAFGKLRSSGQLAEDFRALTALGGRLVGSESEAAGLALLRAKLGQIEGLQPKEHAFEYRAWANRHSTLELTSSGAPRSLPCHALYWSAETPAEGTEAEVVDVGRGTEEEFRAAGARLKGNIALVRHEYPFASDTIHRRVKYGRSRDLGAAAFLIANNLPGELLVTGSCGQDAADNIPGLGVSLETGALLSEGARARVRIANRRDARTATNLTGEIRGRQDEVVLVCAHYDGHDLAQSALDNATGVVSALAVARAVAPYVPQLPRGLRIALFTAEESGLLGSRRYVESLAAADRRRIAVVINLDTLTGSARLTCLTSGFDELESFVARTGERAGLSFGCVKPLMRNSDHFNFAERGIPALRVVAGFDDVQAGARYLLTQGDTADKVPPGELESGALAAAELVWSALTWPGPIARHKAVT
jgi:hypothetical protein